MKNNLSFLVLIYLVLFSQCKNQKKAIEVPTNVQLNCLNHDIHIPRYSAEIMVSDIFYEKDTLRIDILPSTFENDTSDLIHSIQKHFKYSEMCLEMHYAGKVYFEISKDSIGNFTNTKVLRGMDGKDGTCTISVLKELNRILKKAPIVEVKDKIDAFILGINIKILTD